MHKFYTVIKDNKNSKGYINQTEISGFHIKPLNNIKYDGIEVSHLVLVDGDLIENILKRKTKKKLDAYLKYLMSVLADDDSDPDDLVLVINDLKRYKAIIINRYAKFLDPFYIKSLISKVKFIETELKRKVRMSEMENNYMRGARR